MARTPTRDDILDRFASWLGRLAEQTAEPVEVGDIDVLLEFRELYLDEPDPTRWDRGLLGALLTELLPARYSAFGADEFGTMLPSLRRFLEFLAGQALLHRRSDGLRPLLAELERLGPDYTDAMGDPAAWGMAKRLFAAADEEGVDLADAVAAQRWMDDVNRRPQAERAELTELTGLTGAPSAEPGGPLYEGGEQPPGPVGSAPPVYLPERVELAEAALTAPLFAAAVGLADWVGERREVTSTGVLRPQEARDAVRDLGFAETWGDFSTAREVRPLHEAWLVAELAGLVEVGRSVARATGLHARVMAGDTDAVLSGWESAWEALADGALEDRDPEPVEQVVLRDGNLLRSLLRELYEHADAFLPVGLALDKLFQPADGGPQPLQSHALARLAPAYVQPILDDLQAYGLLEQTFPRPVDHRPGRLRRPEPPEGAVGVDEAGEARLTPLGLYVVRRKLREHGVLAPLAADPEEAGRVRTELTRRAIEDVAGRGSFPPLQLPPDEVAAAAVRRSPLLGRAVALAEQVALRPELRTTASEVLRPESARRVLEALGIVVAGRFRSARDVHVLHRRWTLALGTGLLELSGGRAAAGPGLAAWRDGDDAAVLELAHRAFAVVVEDESTLGEEHGAEWDGGEEYAGLLVAALVQEGGPVPLPELVAAVLGEDPAEVERVRPRPAEAVLSGFLDAADLGEVRRNLYERGWASAVEGPPDDVLLPYRVAEAQASLLLIAERMVVLGAVTRSGDRLELTELGLVLVHRFYQDLGLPVRTSAELAQGPAAEVLGGAVYWPQETALRELAAWTLGRPAVDALGELLAAAAAAGPLERITLFGLLDRFGPPESDIDLALTRVAADPTLAPHIWHRRTTQGLDVGPPTPRTLVWLAAEEAGAAFEYEGVEGVLEVFGPLGEEDGPDAALVLGELAVSGHPVAEEVLTVVARAHPVAEVAEVADRALAKLQAVVRSAEEASHPGRGAGGGHRKKRRR